MKRAPQKTRSQKSRPSAAKKRRIVIRVACEGVDINASIDEDSKLSGALSALGDRFAALGDRFAAEVVAASSRIPEGSRTSGQVSPAGSTAYADLSAVLHSILQSPEETPDDEELERIHRIIEAERARRAEMRS